MGIFFGSTGIKPYVGSKEVQEAYVGSTLVYKSAPPEIVIFDGYTSNVINEIATNGSSLNPVVIRQNNNVYYMFFTGTSSSLSFPTLNRTQIFIDNTNTNSRIGIMYYNDNTYLSESQLYNNTATFTIPENCNKIIIKGVMANGGSVVVCKLL